MTVDVPTAADIPPITLPKHDPDPEARAKSIEALREAYQFDYEYYNLGFAKPKFLLQTAEWIGAATRVEHDKEAADQGLIGRLVSKVEAAVHSSANRFAAADISQGYPIETMTKFVEQYTKCMVNAAKASAVMAGRDIEREAAKVEKRASTLLGKGLAKAEMLVEAARLTAEYFSGDVGPLTMQHYLDMFQSFEMPEAAKLWDEDWFFAYLTVAGPIATRIRCIDALPDNFPVTEDIYRSVMGEDAVLADDLRDNKVFLLDYSLFGDYRGGVAYGHQKYCYAPMALFAWRDTTEHEGFGLTPVAIQCGPEPGPAFPIWTPADGWRWKMARYTVQCATGCYRGAREHFGALHVLMDRVTLATRRTLAYNHPIYALVEYHLRYTNSANVPTRALLADEGYESTLLPCWRDATVQMILDGISDFRFDTSMPPALFESRGLGDPSVLPMYPFREDTTKLWDALFEFVEGYVGLYYASDAEVADDPEVQAWVRELQAPDGARLKGLGDDGQIQTVAALTMLVAQIIYRGSAYHSAVNDSGFELFTFSPMIAYAGHGAPPTADTPDTEASFLAMLPPLEFALNQFIINAEQITIQGNQFGTYPDDKFVDKRVAPLTERLRARCDAITKEIEAANERRPFPYVHQIPGRVSASLQS